MTELFKHYCLKFVACEMSAGEFLNEILKAFGGNPTAEDLSPQGLYNALQRTGQYNNSSIGAVAFFGKNYQTIIHAGIIVAQNLIIEGGEHGVRIRPLKSRNDLVATILPKYQ